MSFFKTNRLGPAFPIKRIFADALFAWAEKLQTLGKIEGSLGYRHALGFVVAPLKTDLEDQDLVLVERWDLETQTLFIRGGTKPPEISVFHALIYQNRSGAIFSFQVGGPEIEKKMTQLILPAVECSDPPLEAPKMCRNFESKLGSGNLIHVPRIGIFSIGCTAEDAGTQLLNLGSH